MICMAPGQVPRSLCSHVRQLLFGAAEPHLDSITIMPIMPIMSGAYTRAETITEYATAVCRGVLVGLFSYMYNDATAYAGEATIAEANLVFSVDMVADVCWASRSTLF